MFPRTLFKKAPDTVRLVGKQTLWQLLGKVITTIVTIITLGYITRNYGEVGTGIYTLMLAYLAFFYLLADLGLNGYILPRLNNNPDEASKLLSFRLSWSLLLTLLSPLFLLLLPFNSKEFNLAVLIGSFSIIFYGIFNSANLIFQKNLRYDFSVLASSIGAAISLPLIYYFATFSVNVSFLAATVSFSWILTAICSIYFARRFYRFELKPFNFEFPIKTLKAAWPITATLVLNTLYFRVDAFILTSLKSFEDVGQYNLAYSIFQNVLVVPTFIMNGFYPLLLKSLENNRQLFFKEIKIGMVGMFFLSLGATTVVWFFSPSFISWWTKGGFLGATSAIQILALSFPAFFMSALFIWTLMSLRLYKQMFTIYVFGLVVNISLNLVLIPQHSYFAASWVTVFSEYLILILQMIILYRVLKVK